MKKIIAALLIFSMLFSGITVYDTAKADAELPEYTKVISHPVKGTLYAVQEEEESQSDSIYKKSSRAAYTLEDLGEIMNQQMESWLSGTGNPAVKVGELSGEEKAKFGQSVRSKFTFSLAEYQIPYDPDYVLQYVYEAIGMYPNLCTLYTGIELSFNRRGIVDLIVYSPVAAGQVKSTTRRYKRKFEELITVPRQAADMSDMEKLLYLHDEIVVRATYDLGDGVDVTVHTPMALLLDGKAVCQSYAGVLNQAANALGITSLQVASEEHAWNAVELDGKWYYLDATHDDPVGNLERDFVSHKYFLFNMEDIEADKDAEINHTLDEINEELYGGILENMGEAYRDILPKELQVQMNYLSGNWFYAYGRQIGTWDGESQNGTEFSAIPSAADRACAVCEGKLYVSGSDGLFVYENEVLEPILDTAVSKMVIISGVLHYKTAAGWQTKVLVEEPPEDIDELEPTPDATQTPSPTPGQPSDPAQNLKPNSSPAPTVASVQAPGRVVISSAKNKKTKSIAIKFKKVKSAAGYQYCYSTNKKFKNSKSKTTKKLTVTIKKLKKKKTYYVRVRAYSIVNNKKIYGKWSKVKSVKIKK